MPRELILPFQPEPIDSLRARYQDALVEVFDGELIALGTIVKPGYHRRNVFDFDDTLRLIISRSVSPCGCESVVIVAWIIRSPETPEEFSSILTFAHAASQRFWSLSGTTGSLNYRGMIREDAISMSCPLRLCVANAPIDQEIEFTIGGLPK